MKRTIAYFLMIGCTAFAATRTENLKVILEKTFFQPQCEPLLNMMAMEAITESEKKIDAEELIEQFQNHFNEEKTLVKFAKPYETLFSDAEILELRKMHENPVWQKYATEAMPILQAQLQNMKEAFKELAVNYATDEKAAIVVADVLEVTQDNFKQISDSKLPVIIDVNATWCHSCQMISPIVDELSEKYKGKIQFAKIDIDSQNELAEKYGVTALPTILFIKPGQKTPAMKSVGYMSKKDFEAKINEFLK
jgi:thioredoxin 1